MRPPYGLIYKVTNVADGKKYIGKTTNNLEKRKRGHIYDIKRSNSYFHRALKKHGENNFKWEVICECETKEILNIMETYKIMVEHSHFSEGKGYNLTWGGDGQSYGFHHKESSKQKISQYQKGIKHRKMLEETKEKLRIINLGKTLTIETKEKISNSNKGRVVIEETKKKIGSKNKGSIRTKESKEVNRIKHLGKKASEQTKWKMRKYNISLMSDVIKCRIDGIKYKHIEEKFNVKICTIKYWMKCLKRGDLSWFQS